MKLDRDQEPPFDLGPFRRYGEALGSEREWEAFCEALRRPLPQCLWVNPMRTTPEALQGWLERCGVARWAEPLTWRRGAWRISAPDEVMLGTLLPYLAGLCHLQEEASLLPVALLAPRPGERVLDTCAAPGGKSAQLALAMENRGTVVANDRSHTRLRALRSVIDRLGLLNVSMSHYNAANFPHRIGHFDRVLADVPCSCEGTSRKNRRVVEALKRFDYEGQSRLQEAILRRGLQRLRPGGVLAYSTCTYAPEENERVVHRALEALGGDQQFEIISPEPLPGFRFSPGLTEWGTERFDGSLRRCVRVWPHHNDTGGFFIALIRRRERLDEGALMDSPAQELQEIDPRPWTDLLEARFGIPPQAFEGCRWHRPNGKLISVVERGHRAPSQPAPISTGLPLIRTKMRYPKMTTGATLAFGDRATRHVLDLDEGQLDAYYARARYIALEAEQTERCESMGYVIVRFEGVVLGQGFYRPDEGEGATLDSFYPKAAANHAGRSALGLEP